MLRKQKLAPKTVEARISALRFLYKKVLRRADLAIDEPFPKTARKLPTILSPDEVGQFPVGRDTDAPGDPDGALRHRCPPKRSFDVEGHRHRQPAGFWCR